MFFAEDLLSKDRAVASFEFVACRSALPKSDGVYHVLFKNYSYGKPLLEPGLCRFQHGQWSKPVAEVFAWMRDPQMTSPIVGDENAKCVENLF